MTVPLSQILSAASAPTAFESIKETLGAFAQLGADYANTKEEKALVKAIEQLRQQLSDNETRKNLLNLLPSLVAHLEIDVEKKPYRIVNHAVEVSAWRKVMR